MNAIETAALDPLSTRVVYLARDEAGRIIGRRGLLSRIGEWFLGAQEAPRPLANDRLEMLRSFCTQILTGEGQGEMLERIMLDKGHYTPGQLLTARHLAGA
jgi:hypothetical protein